MSSIKKKRGVVWHVRQKAWRVKVSKIDKSVCPPRHRLFYREFKDLATAIRVRDYVARMLHGPGTKLNRDGRLPPSVSRDLVFCWLIVQNTIDAKEVPYFTARVKHLDNPTSPP